MNFKKIILVIATLALVIAGVAFALRSGLFLGSGSGATHFQKESFLEGLFVGNSRQVNIDRSGNISTEADLTVGGGNLNVTTSNTATSTVVVGCVNTYATSTATSIALVFNSVSTSSTNMLNGQTNNGFVLWKYGSCPL